MDNRILDLNERVLFFPVRHHSPACARVLRRLALKLQPEAVLIEGPSDFNDRIPELYLPHDLPIAIYTFIRLPDGVRRGAFYPFCVYSPEWQALQVARELGAEVRFVDLPWAEMAGEEVPSHRYSDSELKSSAYIEALCRRLGVEDFDTLWDTLFEIQQDLTPEAYLERCHPFCFNIRAADEQVPEIDLRREAFMADQIRRALDECSGKILVVTGGFHSHPLFERIQGSGEGSGQWSVVSGQFPTLNPQHATLSDERGIALTPYSYERLDSLTGYEAGMPSPGFYHHVWHSRIGATSSGGTGHGAQRTESAPVPQRSTLNAQRSLLAQVVRDLRSRGQVASSADLIAVETTARALAALRGHEEVWRADLIDGITGSLIKEELEHGVMHPFLAAVFRVFRGGERGRLAAGTELPPLVNDLRRLLAEHDLEPAPRERTLELDLNAAGDVARSRLLHRLRVLGIAGYARTGGTDLAAREDLARIWEEWRVRWSPDFDATCIEAAIYGPSLAEAAGARLLERAEAIERDAEQAALLLLDAGLMGLTHLTALFYGRLIELIREDGSFFTVTSALGHLLYMYRYDEVLGTAARNDTGALLVEAFGRGLWLLEGLGPAQGMERELLRGVGALLNTFERCASSLELSREELVEVLGRVGADSSGNPLLRGAVTGALWTLGEAEMEQVLADLRYCSDPPRLGDFLTGLFHLARETVQRHPELVLSIDELLVGYGEEEFLEALPALRLAFSYFTPREKHYMARTLLRARGVTAEEPLAALEVSPETAARVLAFEVELFAAVRKYGLRGGTE
jgi:uncharacterized protein DUF5682